MLFGNGWSIVVGTKVELQTRFRALELHKNARAQGFPRVLSTNGEEERTVGLQNKRSPAGVAMSLSYHMAHCAFLLRFDFLTWYFGILKDLLCQEIGTLLQSYRDACWARRNSNCSVGKIPVEVDGSPIESTSLPGLVVNW